MPRDAGRNAQSLRQLALLSYLGGLHHGATLDALAGEFGVTTRTMRRDLAALRDLGFDCEPAKVEGPARYKVASEFARKFPTAKLSAEEMTALLLAFDSVSADMPFATQFRSAMQKIEQALPDSLRTFMLEARTALSAHFAPPVAVSNVTQASHLRDWMTATRGRRVIMMGYDAAYSGTSRRYRLEPYRVVASQGAFYLCAWVPSRSAWRVFALHRVESLAMLDQHFAATRELAADPFGHSLGPFIGEPVHVELAFAATTARYVAERRWHTSQGVTRMAGGQLALSLDVCPDYALTSWILGFGHTVEVLAPPALVEWHRHEAAAMLESTQAATGRRRDVPVTTWRSPAAPAAGPHDQRPLPFSTDWHPSPPVIVADTHDVGASEAYEKYIHSLTGFGRTPRPDNGPVASRPTAASRRQATTAPAPPARPKARTKTRR